MRHHRECLWPALFMLVAAHGEIWSMPERIIGISSPEKARERIVGIAHLNADCHPDTVLAAKTADGNILLTKIRWGAHASSPGPEQGGDSCASRTPFAQRQRETVFRYPAWNIRAASVSLQRLDNDPLTDIILHVRGTVKRDDGKEEPVRRSLAIFAQPGLDSLAAISIDDIARIQAAPFFAMELAVGAQMTKRDSRDLSGRASYLLEPVRLNRDTIVATPAPVLDMPALAEVENEQNAGPIRLFPNPTAQAIQVETTGLAAGRYHLAVIGVNGAEQMRREMMVTNTTTSAMLDVARIPSGYYAIRINDSEGRTIGLYPLIITR